MHNRAELKEIRCHGRGGQGAVTAAHILAEAAFLEGYRGVTSVPAFGAERRGVPVSASTRFSGQPIRILSQVETPDVVVVLDETLFRSIAVAQGLRSGGWLIVNSSSRPEQLPVDGVYNVAVVDATKVALELGITVGGLVLVNTAILGAFAKATGLVSMASIEAALRKRFAGPAQNVNVEAARRAYDRTVLRPV